MAHLYLADKYQIRKQSIQKLSGKAKTKDKQTVRDKKAEQSWGDTMGGILKFIKWVDRYKIYQIAKYRPLSALNGWGHLLGSLVFGTSYKIRRRIMTSLKALHPQASQKTLELMLKTHVKYMGMFLMDIMFRMPFICDYPEGTQVKELKYLNFERLDEALQKGKGVIILILHIGQHFHNPGGIFLHPKKYPMSVVASVKNLPMYEFNNRPHFDNLYIYASTKFAHIAPQLRKRLEKNEILVMYHDYSAKTQLKVPFITGKLPFLINTPQSYIRLHRLTGAEILPLITLPDGVFGKSKLFFIDNSSIKNISQQFWDAPMEDFHGRMSTEINRIMYPWVVKYAPWWEELMRLAGMRSKDELKIPANITLKEFLSLIQEKMHVVIDGSWEPGRKDSDWMESIDQTFQKIFQNLKSPEVLFREHKSRINLTCMTSQQEMQKLTQIAKQECEKKGEKTSAGYLSKLINSFNYSNDIQR